MGRPRKYNINENYFKKWSPNMAYILGFWFSDGYIYKRKIAGMDTRYIFGISQCERYILEDILNEIGSDYPIHKENQNNRVTSYRFLIDSKEIVNNIIKLGGCYRKSLVCKFPYVPKKYLPDFIRGLWDGDGSVFWSRHLHGSKSIKSSYCSGSKKFVDKMLGVLRENIVGLKGNIYKHFSKKVYYITFDSNDTIRLKDFMYKNINKKLRLNRKYKLFSLCGNIIYSTHDRKFLDIDVAKKIIKKLNFKNVKEWQTYSRSGKMSSCIPKDPAKSYSGKGWVNFYDWIGKEKPVYLSFLKARCFMSERNRKLNLKTWDDWKKYSCSSSRPKNIPPAPNRKYKNKGWVSLADWLGKKPYDHVTRKNEIVLANN